MKPRESLFVWTWTYLRGWLVIGALVFWARLAIQAAVRAGLWLEPLLEEADLTAFRIPLVALALVLVPWLLGKLSGLGLELFRDRSGVRALQRMEESLAKEVSPDEEGGYRVALVNWPNREVRTLGVVTSTFLETGTQRKLAAVYLPGAPDPSRGFLRVVPVESLVLLDWVLQDALSFQITYGRLARRTLKKYRKVQALLADGDCTSCAHSAFRRWKDLPLIQIVLIRLAREAEGQEPGYHFQLFTDRFLRPVTLSNGIRFGFDPERSSQDHRGIEIDRSLTVDRYQAAARVERGDWYGRKHFLKPSDDRLQAGFLYKRKTPDPTGQSHCLKLRLFTDYRIEPGLQLRIDLREERNLKADVTLRSSFFIGAPTEIVQSPIRSARYHYDVPIPYLDSLKSDTAHTMLVRVLNPEGFPVTEEQQIRFRTYEVAGIDLPEGCVLGAETDAGSGEEEPTSR